MKIAGYCKLCRAKEIELYGKVVNGPRHKKAVILAGCKHPHTLVVPRKA